jgi:hypothetical protein
MIDPQLLTEYTKGFYGYGNYRGRYWFVGIEEGGAETLEDNAARIDKWDRRGRPELDALNERDRYDIQETWGKLIRILLAATYRETDGDGISIARETVRGYQRYRLGRADGDTCLIELLPLSSKSTGHWMWGGLPEFPQLNDRKVYEEHYSPIRAAHIADRIREYRPPAVVFYGFTWTYRQWWEQIANVDFEEVPTEQKPFYIGDNGHTVFAITQHPAFKFPPAKNEYFHKVGYAIASRLHRGR